MGGTGEASQHCALLLAETQGRGTSLRDWLGRGLLLIPHQALDFAIDICRGLIHTGRKQPGLVHRDLKPESVLIIQEPLALYTVDNLLFMFLEWVKDHRFWAGH